MRFNFTLNMPSRSGNAVHQIIGEHSAQSLSDLLVVMANTDFLLVEEFYVRRDSSDNTFLESAGLIALNPLFIGKVKVTEDRTGAA